MRTPLYGRSHALTGMSPAKSRSSASISMTRLGRLRGLRIVGSRETPSIVRPAFALAASTSVGAKSMFATWPFTVLPAGTPGPRTISGMRTDSS